MKLLLSTSNIISGDGSILRPPGRSDSELTNSLRSNFTSSRDNASSSANAQSRIPFQSWTTQDSKNNTLYIPSIDTSSQGLAEERPSYDITVKLFYLPNVPPSRRCTHTREAIELVLKELGVHSIDLLIVSFPNIVFDADDETSSSEDEEDDEPFSAEHHDSSSLTSGIPEEIPTILETWRTIESLHTQGTVSKLGVAEFGTSRLTRLLSSSKVKPKVDQINVRDCCVVPKPLILFAKREGIELLTHSDCTNILPRGTLRELLGSGEKGVGVLDNNGDAVDAPVEGAAFAVKGLKGELEPQWVIKYTAVVRNRGVVENKGYFALAELRES